MLAQRCADAGIPASVRLQSLAREAKVVPCAGLQVFALGFVSVFDQIVEGLPEPITQEVYKAYVDALQEDPQQFRRSVPAG